MVAAAASSESARSPAASRRDGVRQRLAAAGLGVTRRADTVAVLRAVQGAVGRATSVTPVWTAPSTKAELGKLTSSIWRLVDDARDSVTCATFNLHASSSLWHALTRATLRTDLRVRVYLDGGVAGSKGALPAEEVARQLVGATVLGSRLGRRTHAKFLIVDHRFVVVTSANLSQSAERTNIELGLIVEDRITAERIERQMRRFESDLYQIVQR